MYAVFQFGSKQFRVIKGQILYMERLYLDIGFQIEFDQVLLIKDQCSVKIGEPIVNTGKVLAKIIAHNLAKKIKIIKFRRRKHFYKHQGHRQCRTQIKIIDIIYD